MSLHLDQLKINTDQAVTEEDRRYCISYDPTRSRIVFGKVNAEAELRGQVFTYRMDLPELQDFINIKLSHCTKRIKSRS